MDPSMRPNVLHPYMIMVNPPMLVPSSDPTLMAAEFRDIIVPLEPGACSRLRPMVDIFLIAPK